MRLSRHLGVATLLVLTVPIAVQATDIGSITLKSVEHSKLATQAFGHAYSRVGNRFLVQADRDQVEFMAEAGVTFEVLLANAIPSSVYLVSSAHPRQKELPAQTQLAGAIPFGNGVYVAELSPSEASSLRTSVALHLRELVNQRIGFRLWHRTVSTFRLARDYPTDTLVDRVNQDSLYAFLTRLEDFQTRYIWTDSIDAARDWIEQKFLDWGYTDVRVEPFWWQEDWHYNVSAVKQGATEPDVVIVVGGHYDSITYGEEPGPMTFAPGADDNASGTAAAMELARIFADVPFRKTVIFAAFSAEEVGLVGSRAAAQVYADSGTNIEVMFNADMVAYEEDGYWNHDLEGGFNLAYRDLTVDAALRLTSLQPVVWDPGPGSDHWAFYEQGFEIVNTIEGDFNWDGWHTNLDISSRLNFNYYSDVVRMMAGAAAIVAEAAHPTDIEEIVDQGDGQSVEILWTDCDATYNYTILYGSSFDSYSDTVEVPPSYCAYVVDGLSEGQMYYFSVVGIAPGGIPAVYASVDSATALVVPRPPEALSAEPGFREILLQWAQNQEADISHYRIYRQVDSSGFSLLEDNVTPTFYHDTIVSGEHVYDYVCTAVDYDGHESDYSGSATSYAATFDAGMLVVDETSQGAGVPSQPLQEQYFRMLFAGAEYGLKRLDDPGDRLYRRDMAPFSSLFWLDDDLPSKLLANNEDSLAWYTGFATSVFVAGFRTIYQWMGPYAQPGELPYDEFGLSSCTENTSADFIGALGQDGWPDAVVDPGNLFGSKVPYIPQFEVRPGAVVIYTFDSFTDNPAFEGQPCGVLYQSTHGPRISLGFPLSYLTDFSAQAIIGHARGLFGETTPDWVSGDANNDGEVNVVDVTFIVGYMFAGGPPPPVMNAADVNGTCTFNIVDLTYLVTNLFAGGEPLLAGCVEQ